MIQRQKGLFMKPANSKNTMQTKSPMPFRELVLLQSVSSFALTHKNFAIVL